MSFFFALPAQTGNDIPFRTVMHHLDAFYRAVPQEKIYVHQDRTVYGAGETIWFKAYQSFSEGIENGSKVLYIDLADGENRLVHESKWPLENGIAAGHIELPDTLASGRYQLRAYTRWMQNFDTDAFFTREIQLYATDNSAKEQERLPTTLAMHLSFFPEGGNLVEGIISKVACKVTDNRGKGIEASGVIVDQDGNEIQLLQTQQNGQGYFYLRPEPGRLYTAYLNNDTAKKSLPKAYPQGVVMNVKYRAQGIRITITHNLNITAIHSPLYLTAHRNGETFVNTYIDLKEPVTVLDIPNEKLPEGIFTLTVYDKDMNAYCERLAFVNYPEQATVLIKTGEERYGKRKKVTLQLNAEDKEGNPQAGNFSLSVTKPGLNGSETRNNFYTDYFLQSELKGRIEQPASYFEQKDSTGIRKLDLLLLTHGWRRYVWDEVIYSVSPELLYPVENGLGFSGKVKTGRRSKEEDITVTAIFRHDSINDIVSFHPGPKGVFAFTGYNFIDTAEVILSAINKKKQLLSLSVQENDRPSPSFRMVKEVASQTGESNASDDFLLVEVIGSISQREAKNIDKVTHELPEVRVTANMKRHSKKRHSELFSKYLYDSRKGFVPRGDLGALSILSSLALDEHDLTIYEKRGASNLYLLLDGVKVSTDVLAGIPVQLIDHVEMLSAGSVIMYTSGATLKPDKFYPIAFWTKEDIRNNDPVKSMTYKFPGYSQPKEFYSPDYSAVQEYIDPDYRNTLHWEPNVLFDKEGKAEVSFYTSDDEGAYTIHCEGRSESNRIGVAHGTLNVYQTQTGERTGI
jgi:hypothetical protein